MNINMDRKYRIGLIYIIGFIVFYFLMEFLHVNRLFETEEKIYAFKTGIIHIYNYKEKPNETNNLRINTNNVNYQNSNITIHPDKDSSPLKLDKEQLGRFSWGLIHSIAASYPQNVTEDNKRDIENFVDSM